MMGYANAARETGHGLLDGWFVSGDRGYFDERGNLVVLGRHDDMLVSGGVNVHPTEVESLLLACPGVTDVAVTGVSDEVWGDRITALVVGEDMQAVENWCRAHLPSAAAPLPCRCRLAAQCHGKTAAPALARTGPRHGK
jgi:O-succinylbenzoic acid--CoA ligase